MTTTFPVGSIIKVCGEGEDLWLVRYTGGDGGSTVLAWPVRLSDGNSIGWVDTHKLTLVPPSVATERMGELKHRSEDTLMRLEEAQQQQQLEPRPTAPPLEPWKSLPSCSTATCLRPVGYATRNYKYPYCHQHSLKGDKPLWCGPQQGTTNHAQPTPSPICVALLASLWLDAQHLEVTTR